MLAKKRELFSSVWPLILWFSLALPRKMKEKKELVAFFSFLFHFFKLNLEQELKPVTLSKGELKESLL